MSDQDEKREQEDVEGHAHGFTDEVQAHGRTDEAQAHGRNEDDETPDFEGHKHARSPVRKHARKHAR